MKQAIIVVGMGFGDEGKGTMTDYFVRRHLADAAVRFNGGPQAAHNVVTNEGLHHTFSQFGSGTLAGAGTFLSRHVLIDPVALEREAEVLKRKGVPQALRRVSVDPRCVIITPFHRIINRWREEVRGEHRHGSVGVGVGEARFDALEGLSLRVLDVCEGSEKKRALSILESSKKKLGGCYPAFERLLLSVDMDAYCAELTRVLIQTSIIKWESYAPFQRGAVIFEGAQGVLLDEERGFAPHNTWTDCTARNALQMIEEAGGAETLRVGVLRSYATRHGAGPLPTEIREGDSEVGVRREMLSREKHNGAHPYMGPFRVGHFDAVLARYAIESCPVDCLAVTHADALFYLRVCSEYREGFDATTKGLLAARPVYREMCRSLVDEIEERLQAPVRFLSFGPRPGDKVERTMTEKELSEKFTPPSAALAAVRLQLLAKVDQSIRFLNERPLPDNLDAKLERQTARQLLGQIRWRISDRIDAEGKILKSDLPAGTV